MVRGRKAPATASATTQKQRTQCNKNHEKDSIYDTRTSRLYSVLSGGFIYYLYILTQWPDKEIIAFLLVEHRPLLVPLLPTSLSPPPCLLPLNSLHISCLLMFTSIPCTNKDKQLFECISKRRREVDRRQNHLIYVYSYIYCSEDDMNVAVMHAIYTVTFHKVQHLDGGNKSKMR